MEKRGEGRGLHFETLVVESGVPGAIVPPIDTQKAQPWDSLDEQPRYPYSRSCPDRSVEALEAKVAALHGDGAIARAFASGQAATDAILSTIKEESHLLCGEQVYGTTRAVIEGNLRGVEKSFVEPTLAILEKAARPNTTHLLIETPTNPLLKVVDLEEVQEFSERHNVKWVLDNTFGTMFLIDGFAYGAHTVYYSASKYFGGHHDAIGGVVVTKDPGFAEELRLKRKWRGSVMAPDTAYRINIEMQTMALRMRRECDNASLVAGYLQGHPKVERVYYPGLPGHPGHEVAARQMRAIDGEENRFGAIVSFEVRGNYRDFANWIAANNRVVYLMESLGSNTTILSNPYNMSHSSVSPEKKKELGIKESLFRLSVGIGRVDDIIGCLGQGLSQLK